MAVIVTRDSKSTALTTAQLDANFTNLNTELATKVTNTANPTFTGVVTFANSTGIDPVVINYPATQPSLMLDFLNSEKLDSRVTFTRTGVATRVNSKGLVETVDINTPRFDYDPLTETPKGLLIEEARTNLLSYSEQFDNAAWSKGLLVSVLANAAVAPSGATNGSIVNADSGVGIHQSITSTTGATYTQSVFVKAGTATAIMFRDDVSNRHIIFNPSTGVITSTGGTLVNSGSQAFGNGWWRYWFTYIADATTLRGIIRPDSTGTAQTFIVWGAQIELGLFATSYIPSLVTHAGRASPATYTDSTGTLRIAPPNTARYQYTLNDLGLQPYLLLESARTNSIRNNLAQGAVVGTPGTLPTNWSVFSSAGLTTSVVSTGLQKGITYIDLKVSGTSTSTVYVLAFDATAATATAGQTWTETFWCSLAAGSVTNVVSVNVDLRQVGGAGNTFDNVFTPTAAFTRFTSSGTLTTGATGVYAAIFLSVTNGTAIDITLRIGMPQLEQGTTASSVIPTPTFASRASGGRYISSNGSLVLETSNSVARYQYDPLNLTAVPVLLMEEARTNSIRNNTMAGAAAGTPGTAPTNWGIGVNGSGLSTSVIGTGTEAGISYIDIRFFGTTTLATEFFITPEPGTNVTATNGQTWTGSFYAKIVAGSTTNLTSVNTITRVVNSSGTGLTASIGSSALNLLSANSLVTNRFFATVTAADATTAAAQTYFRATHNSGVAVDITLRIGMPQLEQGSGATSVIGTSIGAAARAADVYTTVAVQRVADTTTSTSSPRGADNTIMYNLNPWYNITEGTIVVNWDIFANPPSSKSVYTIADSTGTNTLRQRYATNGTGEDAAVTVNSVVQASLSTTAAVQTLNTSHYSANAYAENNFARSINGQTVLTDTLGTVPLTVDKFYIGKSTSGDELCGHIRRIAYYPLRLTNAEMQLLTT